MFVAAIAEKTTHSLDTLVAFCLCVLPHVALSICMSDFCTSQDSTWNAVQDHHIIDVNVCANMKIFFHLYRKIAARPVASASSSSSSSAHGLVVPSGKRGSPPWSGVAGYGRKWKRKPQEDKFE